MYGILQQKIRAAIFLVLKLSIIYYAQWVVAKGNLHEEETINTLYFIDYTDFQKQRYLDGHNIDGQSKLPPVSAVSLERFCRL